MQTSERKAEGDTMAGNAKTGTLANATGAQHTQQNQDARAASLSGTAARVYNRSVDREDKQREIIGHVRDWRDWHQQAWHETRLRSESDWRALESEMEEAE